MHRSESKPTSGSRPCSAARLNQPKDADQAIEEMVKSAPENYLVTWSAAVIVANLACQGAAPTFRRR